MTPEDNQSAVNIAAQSNRIWGVECTKILRDTYKVTLSMLPQMHTYIILANGNPSHIARDLTQDESYLVNRFIKEDKAKADKQRKKSNYGLNVLQLKPEHLSGVALFEN